MWRRATVVNWMWPGALGETVLSSGSPVVTDLDELSAIQREVESYLP